MARDAVLTMNGACRTVHGCKEMDVITRVMIITPRYDRELRELMERSVAGDPTVCVIEDRRQGQRRKRATMMTGADRRKVTAAAATDRAPAPSSPCATERRACPRQPRAASTAPPEVFALSAGSRESARRRA